MAKKLNSNDRRKLLEARDDGLSDSEMKRRFGIIDDRTLRRNLRLAEQEQEPRIARAEILRDAIKEHLLEVRQLIDNWNTGFRVPSATDPISTMTFVDSLQSNRLFACLKSHLPFPILWKNYGQWEAKYRSYVDNCDKLREEIQREATARMLLDFMDDNAKVSHLPSQLIAWILRHVEYKLQKRSEEKFELRWKYYKVEVDKQPTDVKQMFASPGGQMLLEIYSQHEVSKEFYEKECWELLDLILKGETVADLLALSEALHSLETKIHSFLDEILLRRDYILYTCNLCPGRPRLLR